MPQTTRLAIPYPAGTDPADVPADLQAIAAQLASVAAGWLPPGTLAARPAPSADIDRHLYFAHDTVEIYACVDAGNDGSWAWAKLFPGGVSDHGALTGLGDDDHVQYVRTDRVRNAVPLRLVRSGKDANDIFTTVEEHRVGGNRATRSVLSGGASPSYTTRTVTEYDLDGVTVLRTTVYTLAYDGAGLLTTETVA